MGIEGLTAYKEFGVAGLFIVMYLGTVWFLIRMLIKDRDKEIDRVRALAQVVTENAGACLKVAQILEQLKERTEAEERKSAELLTYIRARDDVRRGDADGRTKTGG
jgi:hypothetical protein